jgi:hypothetical protein
MKHEIVSQPLINTNALEKLVSYPGTMSHTVFFLSNALNRGWSLQIWTNLRLAPHLALAKFRQKKKHWSHTRLVQVINAAYSLILPKVQSQRLEFLHTVLL